MEYIIYTWWKSERSSCKCFLSSATMLELFRDPAELQRSERRDRRAVISLWKLIRHLCKREKLERRHLQLSDEASLSERLPFLFLFFLREDQIAALYITKELPAWPALFSLLSDAAGLSISRRTFLLYITCWLILKTETRSSRFRPNSCTDVHRLYKLFLFV